MREARILYLALGMLLVVSVGAVSLHDKGIEFPDGSFQETAAGFTASTAVQGQVNLSVAGGFVFCSNTATVYTVPAGKRLVVEWIAAESAIFGGMASSHPVEVDIITHDGSGDIFYPLVRLEDPIHIGESLVLRAGWQGPVRIYTEPTQQLRAKMCFDSSFEFAEGVGTVGFSGYLVDV